MKKLFLFAIAAVLCSVSLMAQKHCTVNQSDYYRLKLTFTTGQAPMVGETVIGGTTYSTIEFADFDHTSAIGSPCLPALRNLAEIPLCKGMSVRILDADYEEFDASELGLTHAVAPLQPSVCKTASRNRGGVEKNEAVYTTNAFMMNDIVEVTAMGIARDRNLAEVVFYPVNYNPVTGRVRIYNHVEAEIIYTEADVAGTQAMKELYYSPAFASGKTINQLNGPKAVRTTAPIRLLILANSMFRGALDEFVNWKRRIGYMVDVAYTGDEGVGTNLTSLTAYTKSQYTNATAAKPAPTFVLLVGDVAQMPAKTYTEGSGWWASSHASDLDYASWTDGDNLPDCYYGRFSAQTLAQLTPQLSKTLMYEQYTFPDPSFLDRAVLVAGIDGGSAGDHGYTHADPAMDYAAKFYVNGDYGYTTVNYYKNNTGINPNATNVTVATNATSMAATIRNVYNQGAGWINYSAHGDNDRWHSPELTNSQVNQMTNNNKCGIMIGNCCLTGKFDESTCFAEALLRKGDNAGAVAYIGGSNSTYWDEDFYWAVGIRSSISGSMNHVYMADKMGMYDHLFHTHDEAFDNWATSMGAMMMEGNMAVQNSSAAASSKAYYWQIYHTFGDPSLMPWLTQANDMTLSQSGFCYGATSVSVNAAPFAYVAITDPNRNLLGAAYADASGHAMLTITAPTEVGAYELAATAQNYKPAFLRLDIWPASISGADDSKVSLYPNPATDRVVVTAKAGAEITVFDMMGRVVITKKIDSDVADLNISALAKGVYYVKVSDSDSQVVRTVVKE